MPVREIDCEIQSPVPAPEEWVAQTGGKIILYGTSTVQFRVEILLEEWVDRT
jgi:hypothetical protein